MITYADLLKALQDLPKERLLDNATILLTETDEFLPVDSINTYAGDGVLDDGHLYLEVVF